METKQKIIFAISGASVALIILLLVLKLKSHQNPVDQVMSRLSGTYQGELTFNQQSPKVVAKGTMTVVPSNNFYLFQANFSNSKVGAMFQSRIEFKFEDGKSLLNGIPVDFNGAEQFGSKSSNQVSMKFREKENFFENRLTMEGNKLKIQFLQGTDPNNLAEVQTAVLSQEAA